MILIIYIYLILSVMILFSLSYCTLEITFNRIAEDDNMKIRILILFGLIVLKYDIPYIDVILNRKFTPGLKAARKINFQKEKKGLKFEIHRLKEMYHKYNHVSKYIFSKIKIDSLTWHTEIGIGEADYTAVSIGLFWILLGNLLSLILKNKNMRNMDIKVIPNYSVRIFQIKLHCIIRIKIANIIIAVIRIGLILLHNVLSRKGGDCSERTSNSRLNENYNG